MSFLTNKQREDLHKAVLEYCFSHGHMNAFNAFKEDVGLSDYTANPSAPQSQLLERKWSSVIRLQKKNTELEKEIATLKEEINFAPSKRANSQQDWVPKAPASYTLQGHRGHVSKVAFHPTYSLLASAGEDATVKIWDWETGEFERTLKGHTRNVNDLDFDSKGKMLVTGSSDLLVKLWDTEHEWKNSKTFPGHEHTVSSVKFMPGDLHIISASRDKTIRIFDVASTHLIRTIIGHTDWVRCVVPSDDGALVASCSSDHTARITDPRNGETKMELRGHDNVVEVVEFAPVSAYPAIRELTGIPNTGKDKRPGAYVVTGSRDKQINLWDTQTGQKLRTFSGHDNWIRALVFHPNGKYLLSASDDKSIRIWDLATGRCTKSIEAHTHFVTCLAWGRQRRTQAAENGAQPNGASSAASDPSKVINVLASGSVDQTVKIWLPSVSG